MNANAFIDVKNRIERIDLEPVKFKVVHDCGYAVEEVEALEKWYRRFLFLTFKHRTQPIVVSKAIDAFWHQHILDTRKYAADCQMAFGEFLHHFPYFGLRGEDDLQALRTAYQATLGLMREEFGDTPDEELRTLGTAASDGELASLCSDCASVIGDESFGHGDLRPRLS